MTYTTEQLAEMYEVVYCRIMSAVLEIADTCTYMASDDWRLDDFGDFADFKTNLMGRDCSDRMEVMWADAVAEVESEVRRGDTRLDYHHGQCRVCEGDLINEASHQACEDWIRS